MGKAEEEVAKRIPKGRKQQHPQYEAASLLGIKPGELDEFLNPGCSFGKKITKELEELWA